MVPEQDVPLEATLAGPRPKPAQSKFRSERLAQAYGTRVPSSTPSTSLGTSVLPSSTSALRGGMRMGRLEPDGQLVGNNDSDGDEEDDAAHTREFVDALYRGDVTNAGVAENSDALIKALESAYGAPSQPQQPPPPPPPPSAPGSDPQKSSRFKLARAVPPSTLAYNESPREGGASLSSKPPTSATVLERKPAAPAPAPSSSPLSFRPTAAPRPPAPVGMGGSPPTAAQLPSMIVNSPSFAPPGGDAPMMVIDSPSFRPPHPSARLTRPPTVLATVRESSPGTQPPPQQQQRGQAPEPGKKVSRFKAQRAES
jgi:Domain of unknown function (DUF3835)